MAFVLQGNKSDLPGSLSATHVARLLGLDQATAFATSAVSGAGVFDALRDGSRQVTRRL